MEKIENLRKRYSRFFYRGYAFDWKGKDLVITFNFEVPPDISFQPKIVVRNAPKRKHIENLVFHLGMMEIPSYWKTTCSPNIIVEAGYLNKQQINWWHDLIMKGMGEYFYKNKINFTQPNFLKIKLPTSHGDRNIKLIESFRGKLQERTLIPLGGGKDAIVTLELLKKIPHQAFVLNPKQEHKAILKIAGLPGRQAGEQNPIIVERTIDPKLLELNRKGFLNGHTPFSAYLAFLTVLVSVLFDYKYIALSNERSSNEGNVKYLGRIINHQYSKSFEFEKKFRQYSKKYLAEDVEYFSFLRPLYELQIAKIFAQYPKYFGAFLSCNKARKTYSGRKPVSAPRRGYGEARWCGKCAKCLFVFLALRPFAGEKQTVRIFGKNLIEDTTMKPLLDELTGKKKFKPFECVGTIKESRAAFSLRLDPILSSWNKNHFLPPMFSRIVKKEYGRMKQK